MAVIDEVDPALFGEDDAVDPAEIGGRGLRPAKLTTSLVQGAGRGVRNAPGAVRGLGSKALSAGKAFIARKPQSVAAIARNFRPGSVAAAGTRVSRRAQIAAKALRAASLSKLRGVPGAARAVGSAAPGALGKATGLQLALEGGLGPLRGLTSLRSDPTQALGTSSFEAAGDDGILGGITKGLIGGVEDRVGDPSGVSISEVGLDELLAGSRDQNLFRRTMNLLGTAGQGNAILGRSAMGLAKFLTTGETSDLIDPTDPDNFSMSSSGVGFDPFGSRQEGFSQEEVARAVEAGQLAKAQREAGEAGGAEDALDLVGDPETGVFVGGERLQGLGLDRPERAPGEPGAPGEVTIGGRTLTPEDAIAGLEARPGSLARRRSALGLPLSGIEVDDNVEELRARNLDLRRQEDERILGLERKRVALGRESTAAFLKRHNLKPSQTSAIARARARDARGVEQGLGRKQARTLAKERTRRTIAAAAAAEREDKRKVKRRKTTSAGDKFTTKQQAVRDKINRMSSRLKGLREDNPGAADALEARIVTQEAILDQMLSS